MPNKEPGRTDDSTEAAEPASKTSSTDNAEIDGAAPGDTSATAHSLSKLRVATIDDAMHPPQIDRLAPTEASAAQGLVTEDPEILEELKALGCSADAGPDERLRAIAEADGPSISEAKLGALSPDLARMIEEHRSFRRLIRSLEKEVGKVDRIDPAQTIPDLSAFDLILLDYFLEGPAGGGRLAIEVASTIRLQQGRSKDQQIVLMSSNEGVRSSRGQFRTDTGLVGAAFAFVSKPDLDEAWKVKAHLGMLRRAKPYAPALVAYRDGLESALDTARSDLLKLVDDLDIGDYAFLQSRALMSDGHPLGDYVFWLLSSQLLAFAFERAQMRERQRELDELEFVLEPFAATEPSTIVGNLLHSALVSSNVGPLGPHPRAKKGGKYDHVPLVRLGDVFFDDGRSKAVVVISADCDLAFSPMIDREPDGNTPVMLVPGIPVKVREAIGDAGHLTEGLLLHDEVYRIVWDFPKYRSVPLAELEAWLSHGGFSVNNRDRLRPLFALKLQQEFGAHLMRVGPPIMPPVTSIAKCSILICRQPSREEYDGPFDLMLSRFKGKVILRLSPSITSALKRACEELHSRLTAELEREPEAKKANLIKKIEPIQRRLEDDDFWIKLLSVIELNAVGTLKTEEPIAFVLGSAWDDPNKAKIVLQIEEGLTTSKSDEVATNAVAPSVDPKSTVSAVSGAG